MKGILIAVLPALILTSAVTSFMPAGPGGIGNQQDSRRAALLPRHSSAGMQLPDAPRALNSSHLFLEAPEYAAGGEPVSVAVGDFNGDGIEDLVVANANSNTISILLGKGHDAFQSPVKYATGQQPVFVAVGDFNGDGKPDLVVANYAANSVSILLGNGDGTFKAHSDFPTAVGPISIAVADFNGDGHADLAVVDLCGTDSQCQSNGTVSILFGNGDGKFRLSGTYGVGDQPEGVAVGDFNGDHNADLAVVNDCYSNSGCEDVDGSVSILLGNGKGVFQPQVEYDAGYAPDAIAVGDFNGDGRQDLAVAGSMDILLGNGDGTFQTAAQITTGDYSVSIVVGDFNHDGKEDLATANNDLEQSTTVSVLLGNGDGTFQPNVDYGVGTLLRQWPLGISTAITVKTSWRQIATVPTTQYARFPVRFLFSSGTATALSGRAWTTRLAISRYRSRPLTSNKMESWTWQSRILVPA